MAEQVKGFEIDCVMTTNTKEWIQYSSACLMIVSGVVLTFFSIIKSVGEIVKVNGSWVEQSDYGNIFESGKIYIKK